MVSASEIQYTRLKGELVFQSFCLKLIRRYWKDDYAEAHGRSGQRQHGADITGRDYRNNYRHAAVQCKASETDDPRQLTEDELVEEVTKAKDYRPKLDILIVAYGGDRDAVIQRKAQELSTQNEDQGLFRVVVWSWDDIVSRALDFPDVAQQLLIHNQVPTTTTLDPKRPKPDALQVFESAVQSAMANLQGSLGEDTARSSGDPALKGKLDVLRDQIREGHGRLLVDTLRRFVANLPDDVHPHLRFRAHANLGAALAQSADLEGAAVAFDAAADVEPGSADSHTYKARAAYLRGNSAVALAEARAAMQILPDRFAATLLVEAAPNTETPESLEKEVAAFAGDAEVASSLVRRYVGADKHREAQRIARAITTQDWHKDSIVGQAILGQYEHDAAVKLGAPLTVQQEAEIDEARERLERAWNTAKARPDWKTWTFIAANLCSSFRLLGRDADADQLALGVFALDPKAPSMAQRAALALARRSDFENAQKAIDSVADESDDSDDLMLAGTIAASRSDWPSADRYAQKAFDLAISDDLKARAAELRVQSAYRIGQAKEALTLASSLRGQFSPTIGFESRVAEIARRTGDTDELEEARKRLAAFGSSPDLDPMDRFELSDAYADDGEWSKAADLLEGLHSLDRPSEILRRRLFALLRADRRADGRALYESLKPGAFKSAEILRVGAAIYERSGMLKPALDALAKAIKVNANDLRSRLDWARLNIRNGTEEPLQKWARRAEAPADGDPEDLMELAQLLDRYGHRRRAMGIGYDTIQVHWGASERLHMMYMSLFLLHAKSEGFLRPKSVGEDSVVLLEQEHGSRTSYRIERGNKLQSGVLPPDHPFASQLLNKKVGDTVTLDEGLGPPATWKIVEIKHKYLDLLHRAMDAHPTLFPNSRSLGQFHIEPTKKDAFDPIFEQARQRSRLVDEASGLYTSSVVPVDGVAKMLGIDAIDASRGLRFQSGVMLDTCVGAREERELALAAMGGGAFLVDVLTLAIWDEIGLLPELERMKLRPRVVQATIDALVQRADEAKRDVNAKGGALQAHGERFVLIETSKADRQAAVDASVTLLEWVRANTELVPTEQFCHELLAQTEKLLSYSSHDTISTAIATRTPLVIEDRRLRGLATIVGAEKTSWTQPLLILMQRDGRISQERYVELIANLVRHKVGFITCGASELFVASHLGYDSKEYQALCEALTRGTVEVVSLVKVAADFIAALWVARVPDTRERLCGEVFERLLLRNDGLKLFRAVVVSVLKNIQSLSFPMSLMANIWNDYIERFVTGHFLREVLIKRA